MNPLVFIYHEVLFQPLFNLLVGITNILPGHNVGLSILIVTIMVRIILLPSSLHQAKHMHKNQTKMAEIKVQLQKIQKKHQNNPQKKAEETMRLYKEGGVNPASGCLPLLIQLPILIALYRVFLIGIGPDTYQYLYSFISTPKNPQFIFLTMDLTQASLVLAVIAGLAQLVLMRMSTASTQLQPAGNDKSTQTMASMQKNMTYIFPIMTIFIAMRLPAALGLYWVATTAFGIVQQYILKKYLNIHSPMAM